MEATRRSVMLFVFRGFNAPAGKLRSSPSTGAAAGVQLADVPQFPLVVPSHVLSAADADEMASSQATSEAASSDDTQSEG